MGKPLKPRWRYGSAESQEVCDRLTHLLPGGAFEVHGVVLDFEPCSFLSYLFVDILELIDSDVWGGTRRVDTGCWFLMPTASSHMPYHLDAFGCGKCVFIDTVAEPETPVVKSQ